MKRSLAALVLLLGCASASRATSLKNDVTDFASYMRWGQVEKAAEMVPASRRITFVAQKRAAMSNMVIHEYDIRMVEPDATGEHARVLIQATWSGQNDPVMRTELLEQIWEWSDRHWQMIEQHALEAPPPTSPSDGL